MFDDFYGFRGRPFQLTPDPAFYFESLTHRKALSYLSYGLAQGVGFIAITGDIGAGKSTLVAHLMATIDRSRLTAAQVVTSRLSGEDMVRSVALAFGLKGGQGDTPSASRDKPAMLAAIEVFLHNEARAGRRCLLVVDECQNLSVDALEELRMLSNFQLGAHPLLQILLLGQPEFRDELQGHPKLEQLRQRVIAAHHLDPMDAAEIEPYIMHRLKLVGWNGNPDFAPAVFSELHRATGGVPRRLNQVVNLLLIRGAVEQRKHIDAEMLAQVLSELTADGGLALAKTMLAQAPVAGTLPPAPAPAPAPVPTAAPAPVVAAEGELPPAAARVPAAVAPDIAAALAERDAQIRELQQAVVELAHGNDYDAPNGSEELHARIAQLEARLAEQERTIRHTLTMLIEWIEREEGPRAAA